MIRSDSYVLGGIADAMDVHLGLPDAQAALRELAALGAGQAAQQPMRGTGAARQPVPGRGQALLATWHNLLDAGRMQDGEPNLAGTARPAVARMSAATAAEAGAETGAKVTIATDRGAITVPVAITQMPDRVVWLPSNSAGCALRRELAAGHGALVTVRSPQ